MAPPPGSGPSGAAWWLVKIESISADPDSLQVSYRYRYNRPGGPTVDDVTLQLVHQDGQYLIAAEQ